MLTHRRRIPLPLVFARVPLMVLPVLPALPAAVAPAAPAAPAGTPPPVTERLCLHCERPVRKTVRGLCIRCYTRPDIRARYPLLIAQGRGSDLGEGEGLRLPRRPTRAAPGSAAKVKIMERRAAAGESIFHPRDMPMDREAAALGVDCQAGLRHEYGRRVRRHDHGGAARGEDGELNLAELGIVRAAADTYLAALATG